MTEISELNAGEIDADTLNVNRDEGPSLLTQVVNTFSTPFIAAFNYILPKNPVTQSREIWYVPKPVENLMGRAMYPVMKANQGGEIEHLFSEECRLVMSKLAIHSKREFDYEVSVLNNNSVNAWCLPGGKVAVYKTLLEKIDYYINNKDALGLTGYTHPVSGECISFADVTRDDVIAALLGHEMTHADARHTARRLEWSLLAQAFVFGISRYTKGVLDGWQRDVNTREAQLPVEPETEQVEEIRDEKQKIQAWRNIHKVAFGRLTQFGIYLYFLAGSRGHELEADKYGMKMATKAGYNAAGALFLQEIFKQETKGDIHSFLPESFHKIQSLFHTHPSSSDRQLALFEDVKAIRMGN